MRPSYAYGVFQAADLAKRLKIPAISVFEFGVAGGRGLVALEKISEVIGKHFGIQIQAYGFDTGAGMPEAMDYRDLPFIWEKGFYKMDVELLRSRLKSAKLILGNLKDTVPAFLKEKIAPIGFVGFDLDYYSSTVDALKLFQGPSEALLPRVYCYFDDIIWPETACHNPYIGELLAIREFNEMYEFRKLCPIHMLKDMLPHAAPWQEQTYVLHDFKHPLYAVNITPKGDAHREIPLYR
jgi:hypothetical protein